MREACYLMSTLRSKQSKCATYYLPPIKTAMALSIADIGGLAPSSPGGAPPFFFFFFFFWPSPSCLGAMLSEGTAGAVPEADTLRLFLPPDFASVVAVRSGGLIAAVSAPASRPSPSPTPAVEYVGATASSSFDSSFVSSPLSTRAERPRTLVRSTAAPRSSPPNAWPASVR